MAGAGVAGMDVMRLRETLGSLLGPAPCAACGRHAGPLCLRCNALVLPPAARATPQHVETMLIGWDYSGPARALVLALKLRAQRTCARPLAEALATRVHGRGLRATALTWVPGRRGDIRRRGFDHAAEIASHLSRSLGLPAFPLLERRWERPDQTELSREERGLNLEGAFRSKASPTRIALVDDLITTGATATACALALKGAGAGAVDLLAACSRDNWGKSDP